MQCLFEQLVAHVPVCWAREAYAEVSLKEYPLWLVHQQWIVPTAQDRWL
jgi:hypothetical protein